MVLTIDIFRSIELVLNGPKLNMISIGTLHCMKQKINILSIPLEKKIRV